MRGGRESASHRENAPGVMAGVSVHSPLKATESEVPCAGWHSMPPWAAFSPAEWRTKDRAGRIPMEEF